MKCVYAALSTTVSTALELSSMYPTIACPPSRCMVARNCSSLFHRSTHLKVFRSCTCVDVEPGFCFRIVLLERRLLFDLLVFVSTKASAWGKERLLGRADVRLVPGLSRCRRCTAQVSYIKQVEFATGRCFHWHPVHRANWSTSLRSSKSKLPCLRKSFEMIWLTAPGSRNESVNSGFGARVGLLTSSSELCVGPPPVWTRKVPGGSIPKPYRHGARDRSREVKKNQRRSSRLHAKWEKRTRNRTVGSARGRAPKEADRANAALPPMLEADPRHTREEPSRAPDATWSGIQGEWAVSDVAVDDAQGPACQYVRGTRARSERVACGTCWACCWVLRKKRTSKSFTKSPGVYVPSS